MSGPADVETLLEHRPFVEAIARRLLRDEHLAQDLVQDAWLATLRSPAPLRSVKAWLNRVAHNLGRRAHRTQARRKRREQAAGRPELLPDATELLDRLEVHRRVVEAVARLEPAYRTVVLLRYYEDLSPREIARRTGVNASTVRTRLQRALAMLRGTLDREHGGDGRSWALALLPLAKLHGSAAATATHAIGGLLAMKKIVLCVAALAILATGWLAWRSLGESSPETSRGDRAAVAPAPQDPAEGSGRSAAGMAPSMESPQEKPARPEGRLVGRVAFLDGTPLIGAVLSIGNDPVLRGITDDEGRLRIAGTWRGRRELMIRSAGDSAWFLTTGVFVAPDGEVDVTLDPGRTITTTVVAREGGLPIAGAGVFLGRTDLEGRPGQGQGVWSYADDDGRIRIEYLPEAPYRYEVLARGYEAVQGTIHLATETFPARFELVPSQRLTVRIEGLAPGFDGSEIRGFVQKWGGGIPRHFKERLDDQGEFRIPAPPAGRHGLVVEAGEVTPRLTTDVEIVAGAEPQPVVLKVPAGASWSGTLLNRDGSPRAGQGIRIDNDGASLRTDEQGFARAASLTAGPKKVVAMIDNGWISLASFDMPDQGAVHTDLMMPGTATVRARVVAGGAPRRTAVVLQHQEDEGVYAYQITGPDGVLDIGHLAAGTYSIETRDNPIVTLGKVVLREGEERDLGTLDVVAGASAVVEVRVPAGSAMPRGFHAYATVTGANGKTGEQVALVFLDAGGRGTLTGFPPGKHLIRLSTPGFVDRELWITLPSTEPVGVAFEPAPTEEK